MSEASKPSPYRGLITARSRRLRVAGALLLAAIVLMSLYGYFRIMPGFRQSSVHPAHVVAQRTGGPVLKVPPGVVLTPVEERARRVVIAQLLFVYFYWTVCGVLILAVLIIAWLDLREIMRTYDTQRAAIWATAIREAKRKGKGGNGANG
jgi:hypothetical protein